MRPHEVPTPGPAAGFGAELRGRLPVLETARLRLRAPVLEDFPLWAEIFCGPEGPMLGGPFTRDEVFREFAGAVGMWLLRGHGPWTVETRAGEDLAGEALGFVLIGFEPGDREPELGMMFAQAARGKGYAAEAARAARDHAFGAMGLPSLVSYIDPANAPSQRLAARLGTVRDGSVDEAEVWRHREGAA